MKRAGLARVGQTLASDLVDTLAVPVMAGPMKSFGHQEAGLGILGDPGC